VLKQETNLQLTTETLNIKTSQLRK